MQLATAMNLRKAMDEETKRERFASWYSTLPGIPAHEKEIIERSLKYNVWRPSILRKRRFLFVFLTVAIHSSTIQACRAR